MGFYYNGKYQTELVIQTLNQPSYTGGIEIVNNEEITFNLKNFSEINNPQLIHKVLVDFGDDTNVTINKPIKKEDEDWMLFSHRFELKEGVETGNISISVYNLNGEQSTRNIQFKIRKESLQEQGIEFNLVSANLRNDKKISYIFNNSGKNQLVLAKNS